MGMQKCWVLKCCQLVWDAFEMCLRNERGKPFTSASRNSCVELNSSFRILGNSFWGSDQENKNQHEQARKSMHKLFTKYSLKAHFKSKLQNLPPFLRKINLSYFSADKFECKLAWSISTMCHCTYHNLGMLFRKNFRT